MEKIKINEFRRIPSGSLVWSIALQENIRFDNDVVIRITNTVADNPTYCYGTIQLVLFNVIGMIPGTTDKHNGDLGLSYALTTPFCLVNGVNEYKEIK